MLEVRTLAQVSQIIKDRFGGLRTDSQSFPLHAALGQRLAEDVLAAAHVPNFNRSTVDGYALISADVFGCSESIPAILKVAGQSLMGEHSQLKLARGECVYVPTGGEVPDGADAVVMLEHAEDFGDGSIGVMKASAPGSNLIFKGDDLKPGQVIYRQGKRLAAADIGTLAALGLAQVAVRHAPVVGLISTGDELVEAGKPIRMGQIRDVNEPMLQACLAQCGAQAHPFGIIKDDAPAIRAAMLQALPGCDALIVTGAPVEQMEFEQVDYWEELKSIMDWGFKNVFSLFFICWGAQAALYHQFGVPKYPLPSKQFGVFRHRVAEKNIKLLRGFDDQFYAPHSRHTEIRREDIEKVPELKILAESDEAGVYIAASRDGRQVFVTGHSEYDPMTLKKEYDRDVAAGLPIAVPVNYYPDDDPSKDPVVRWRGHAHLLFANWINYYVYQETPYDLSQFKGFSPIDL